LDIKTSFAYRQAICESSIANDAVTALIIMLLAAMRLKSRYKIFLKTSGNIYLNGGYCKSGGNQFSAFVKKSKARMNSEWNRQLPGIFGNFTAVKQTHYPKTA
jgi:hypothetical protein